MRKKISIPAFLMCLFIYHASASADPVTRVRWIQSPLFSGPAIVLAGKTFRLEFKPEEGLTLDKVSIQSLNNASVDIPCQAKSVGDSGGVSQYDVTVPPNVPENLYNLAVRLSNGKFDYQPHSVKVIKTFKKDFDFVQLTDIHFNVQDAKNPDMNRIRRKLLQDISAMKPEFVIFSGDLGLYPESYDIDYVYGYEQFSQWLTAPMFMVPGNHEQYVQTINGKLIDGRRYWTETYGSTYRSFDYGNMHFIGINSFDWPSEWRENKSQKVMMSGSIVNSMITPEQWDWVKADLGKAKSEGKTCVAFTHIPVGMMQGGRKIGFPPNQYTVPGPDKDAFVDELNAEGCTHVFIGHMHYNLTNRYKSLTEVLTIASGIGPGGKDRKWGYRIIHVKNGKITGWTMHEVGFSDLDKANAKN